MCRELEALRQSIQDYSRAFDARSLIPSQAREVVRLCTQIKACVSSVESLAAAVAAEGSSHKAEGYRSADEQLAHQAGMSPTQARRTLATGRRMLDQPHVAAAALAGQLSPEQAAAVAAGVEANPARTAELIRVAREGSLPELNEAVAQARADAADREARRRAIHARRTLSRFVDPEGVYHAYLSGNPEDGITIDHVLTQIRRKLITLRREQQAPNEKMAALDYDAMTALFDLARGLDSELTFDELLDLGLFPQHQRPGATTPPTPPGPAPADPPTGPPDLFSLLDDTPPATCGTPPPATPADTTPRTAAPRLAGRPAKIIIRIDLDTLLRGYPLEGETCDCPGYGPIPVSLVHHLMATGQARLAGFLTKGHELRAVHLERRHPNEYQKTALDYLYPVCAAQGCNTRAGLQADHREDWARTHYTVIDLLDYLCWHHHQLKTNHGWALVDGHGKRHFVPPTDSRHPRHRPKPDPVESADPHPRRHPGPGPQHQPAAPADPDPSSTPPPGTPRCRSR